MGPRQSIENIQATHNKLEKTVAQLHKQMPGSTAKNQELLLRHLHETISQRHQTTEESLRDLFITGCGVVMVILVVAFVIVKLFKRFRKLEKSINHPPPEDK